MVSLSAGFVAFVLGTALTLVVPVLAIWLLYKVFQGVFFVLGGTGRLVAGGARHVGRFAQGEVMDSLHLVGALLTAVVILPLALANIAILRIPAARHYLRAFEDEFTSALLSLYRIGLGHPIRLLGLGILTEGLERRLPELVARAPRTSAAIPARRAANKGAFEGYRIERELQAGGSGARLFLARPNSTKQRELEARGHRNLGQVVIKAFDRSFGATLPQIVRESRALDAAKRLGHVLEHQLDDDQFHYVMPFVPGDDLDVVTRRMHATAGDRGLDRKALAKVVGYASDLCATLERFHGEGLWHKDVKPSNLLVSSDRLQLVDLGLVTPLASAMTLTTHGTEYYRDPELVRLAMRGAKVHEVDGVKFDVYSAGAVLYSILENSFPAHGSLSRLSKPAPEALAWIVRRAMSDVSQRYTSAREMWRDLQAVQAADDMFKLRPADLPSVRARLAADEAPAAPRAQRVAFMPEDRWTPPPAPSAPEAPNPMSGREVRRAARAAHREERHAARAARRAARHGTPTTAGTVRRRARRGVLGAFVCAIAFFALVGGAVALKEHRDLASRSAKMRVFAQDRVAEIVEREVLRLEEPRAPEVGPFPWAEPTAKECVLVLFDPRVPGAVRRNTVEMFELDGWQVYGVDDDPADIAVASEAQRRLGAGPVDEAALKRAAAAPFEAAPVVRIAYQSKGQRPQSYPLQIHAVQNVGDDVVDRFWTSCDTTVECERSTDCDDSETASACVGNRY